MHHIWHHRSYLAAAHRQSPVGIKDWDGHWMVKCLNLRVHPQLGESLTRWRYSVKYTHLHTFSKLKYSVAEKKQCLKQRQQVSINTRFSDQMFPDLTKGCKSLAFSAEGGKLHPMAEGSRRKFNNPESLFYGLLLQNN